MTSPHDTTTGPIDDTVLARPGQPLLTDDDDGAEERGHVNGVCRNALALLPNDATTPWGDDLQTVMRAVVYTHDICKATSWWQRYIRDFDPNAPTEHHTNHSLPSAITTLHTLYEASVSRQCQVAAFWAVVMHHSVIPDVIDGDRGTPKYSHPSKNQTANIYNRVSCQLTNAETNAPATVRTLIDRASNGAVKWDDLYTDRPAVYSNLIDIDEQDIDPRFYHTLLRIWTTLTCADKLDAAGIDLTTQRDDERDFDDVFVRTAVQDHIDDLSDPDSDVVKELNRLRTRGRKTARQTLMEHADTDHSVFTLTLPTGFGKTLASLEAAVTYCNDGHADRVIYAMPFTSIVDQTDEVIRNVFSVDPGDPEYTVHHSLRNTFSRIDNGDQNRDPEHPASPAEALLGETLLSHVNLTTFVQLFESVAGPGNVQGIKLPALQNSVIIIDEPQAITLDWWYLISWLIEILDDEYNATVILMTATQPKIIDACSPTLSPTPLIPDRQPYFDFLGNNERVRFFIEPSLQQYLGEGDGARATIDPRAAATRLVDDLLSSNDDTDTRSLLSVGNTVHSVRTMGQHVAAELHDRGHDTIDICSYLIDFRRTGYDALCDAEVDAVADAFIEYLADRVDTQPSAVTASLTTRLRPADRSLLIATIDRILDSEHDTPFDETLLLVTSTQLIEAGVDISFDVLYRDFAPLSSIVQSAGRCNRAFDAASHGEVHLWRLNDDSGIPSEIIYTRTHNLLRPTRQALATILDQTGDGDGADATAQHAQELSERVMVSDAVDAYYDTIHHAQNRSQQTDHLVHCVEHACGDKLRQASMIDSNYPTVDIIVTVTDDELDALDRYRAVRDDDDASHHDRQEAFHPLRELIVSVPVSQTSLDPRSDDNNDADDDGIDGMYAIHGRRGGYIPTNGEGIRGPAVMFDTQI